MNKACRAHEPEAAVTLLASCDTGFALGKHLETAVASIFFRDAL